MSKPLKIGLSPRFLHQAPPELGFKGKKLQYLGPSIAHWLMTANALVFMIFIGLPASRGRDLGVQHKRAGR